MPGPDRRHNRRLAALASCVLLMLSLTASAELPPISVYGKQDGLAHPNVRSILQDSRGFLWMGTMDGLSRFDGSRFVNYGRDHGLPGAQISCLLEIEDGVLLVGTDLGLYRFDVRAETPFAEPSTLDPARTGGVHQLRRAPSGRVWAGTDRGLFSIGIGADGTVLEAIPFESQPATAVRALHLGRDGSLWIGSATGLLRYTPTGEIEDPGIDEAVRALAEDRAGRIWIGLEPGLAVLLPTTAEPLESSPAGLPSRPGEIRTMTLEQDFGESPVRAIHLDGYGSLWIGSVGALYEFDGVGLRRYGVEHGLSDPTINAIFEDRSGQMWFGSDLGGAMRWSREGLVSYTAVDGLGHETVDSISEADGQVWIFNAERAILSRPQGDRWVSSQLDLPRATGHRGLRLAESAMRDSHGQWWITTGAELLRYTDTDELIAGGPIARYTVDDGLASNTTFKVVEDQRGDLWIFAHKAAAGILTRWRRADQTFERSPAGSGLPERGFATSFAEISGQMFFGWSSGAVVRRRSSRFEVFEIGDGIAVRDLLADRAGRLWVATSGGGLYRCVAPASESPSWTRVAMALPRDCRALAEDRLGRIYIGTVAGVYRMDPKTDRIETLVAADDSQATEITTIHADGLGSLWFGSYGGVLHFEPRPRSAALPTHTYIGGIRIDGVPYPVSGLGRTEIGPLELAGSARTMQFDYFGLTFDLSGNLRFQFRLEGAEGDWSPVTDQPSVLYANLSPGSYRFEVRCVSDEGAQPAAVSFRIPPPLWKRAWFLGLLVLSGVYLLILAHRMRLNRLIAAERVRTRIAADLHDDIGASLSRISLLSEVAKSRQGDDRDETLGRIGDVARDLSRRTREIVWSMNPRFDDLESFVVRLRETAGELLDDRAISWDLVVPEHVSGVRLRPEARRHLLLVYKEALLNVIRHASAGSVSLSVILSARTLRGKIRDDGVGFDPDELSRHSGSGLRNIESRIAELGGRFELRSSPGEGTILEFELRL